VGNIKATAVLSSCSRAGSEIDLLDSGNGIVRRRPPEWRETWRFLSMTSLIFPQRLTRTHTALDEALGGPSEPQAYRGLSIEEDQTPRTL
jgi:hypothetical protein